MVKETAARAPRWGFRIYWNGGVVKQAAALSEAEEVLESDAKKRSVYGDCTLQLNQTDARALGDELQALYEKYLALGKAEGEAHLLFVGFTLL